MPAVFDAGFAELDCLGPVAQIDALHGQPSQCGRRKLRIAGLGGQAERVRVVTLGESAQFGGVSLVLGHPAGEVDELGGRGEQLVASGLGEAALQPGGYVLGEVADGQVAGVAAAELGGRVAEGLHHVAHGRHLALADADSSGRGGLGPAGDAVHVRPRPPSRPGADADILTCCGAARDPKSGPPWTGLKRSQHCNDGRAVVSWSG
ncbi:hypothetical protein [Streptomyces sp. NPDC088246]|uniref:hypothetical protein n=1 Tax=Streptomyces sp. NPDC088246 TaxID=3365842 RepID=UPI00382C0462